MAVVAAAAVATAAGAAGLGAGASSASAAQPAWGYEQITPADSSATPIVGIGVSPNMGTVFARTRLVPIEGMPSDGRAVVYSYGLPRGGAPWTLGPVDVRNGSQIGTYVEGVSADGSHALYKSKGLHLVDAAGLNDPIDGGLTTDVIVGSDDLSAMAFMTPTPRRAYLGRPGQAPVLVSVDDDGTPLTPTALGGGTSGLLETLSANAIAADGSSVIFTSADPIAGDDDGGHRDVFLRTVTPGAERTIEISDANDAGATDAAADADYRWATASHRRIFFVTAEGLEPGDTDGEQDLYMRDGTSAPVRISQGETVDGAPTGNGSESSWGQPEWVMSSQDGNRTFFLTTERLTPDAPETTGRNLYERDVAEHRTRFVAELTTDDATALTYTGRLALSFRPIRVTPDGAVFAAKAALAGAPDDGQVKIFSWTRDGGLTWISRPDADAPSSPAADASLVPLNVSDSGMFEFDPILGGRAVSDDGSRVFFTTGQSLTAGDDDGGRLDVYSWTADGGLRLVTPPGRAPYDATYLDSSPDGTEVYFNTAETILPGDVDPNAMDVYLAILGGGAAPGKPGPDADPQVCTGDACQGPIGAPALAPGIGSISFAGRGNVVAPPSRQPSRRASLAIAHARVVRGAATRFRVKVAERGRVRISGPRVRRASKAVRKAGTVRVAVRLSKQARRMLARRHRVRVRVTVRFAPREGRAVVKRVRVTFTRSAAGHARQARVRAAIGKADR